MISNSWKPTIFIYLNQRTNHGNGYFKLNGRSKSQL